MSVEAELGTLAGIEDENTKSEKSSYTRPADVIEFVKRTGVDSLAIAIGTSHGAYKFKPGRGMRRYCAVDYGTTNPCVLIY